MIKISIFSIKGEKSYINEIFQLIKLLLYLVEKNSNDCFQDFQILCNLMNTGLINLKKDSLKYQVNFYGLKISYSITIFILLQLKNIFKIPNSIVKIHKDIIEEINKIDENISEHLDQMDVEKYLYSKLDKKVIDNLKNYLQKRENLDIDTLMFRKILDLIIEKLFGKTSSLFQFLEGQNCKIIMNDELNKNNLSEDMIKSNYNSNCMNDIELNFLEEKEGGLSDKKDEQSSQQVNLPKCLEHSVNECNNNNLKSSLFSIECTENIKI
jgi:hypothetical protein